MSKKVKKVPGSVLDILKHAVQGKVREPNYAELVQHFFELAGGERAVAKMMVDTYNAAATPHTIRTKIIQIMLNHLKTVNEHSGMADELALLNDEDLVLKMDEHVRAIVEARAKRMRQEQAQDKPDTPDQEALDEPERRSQQTA